MLRHSSWGYDGFNIQGIGEELFVVSRGTTCGVVIWIVEGELDDFRFGHDWMIATTRTLLAISCTCILRLY